ncbi:MAG: three-Cys-motif partner protein TcmP [Candidatus Hydrothermarchaeota archaeon]|nr:three-Cys-motif partner protein TcmP [Candidatus Hydrothermarchaeota archaeon]
MPRKLSERGWVERYKSAIQNEELISAVNLPDLPTTPLGAWTFLKLACLWSFAYYTYTPIIGGPNRYPNMCYVDLFSGSGLVSFQDYSGNTQILLGSPVLMATINSQYPFKKCYFFEKEKYLTLEKRLEILKNGEKLTCGEYKSFPEDCNTGIDRLIKELRSLQGAHFLLFVDPFSTEIHWSTMEKLLSLSYPAFDMFFTFQPFGVNRKSYMPDTLPAFFGDKEYKKYLNLGLDALESYYIQKLRQFKMVKTVHPIRVDSGKGGYYYDIIYTTRKESPPWIKGIEHLKNVVERLTGYEVSVILDPTLPSLDKFE